MLFNFSSSHVSKRAELTSIDSAVPMIIFKPDGTVKYANTLFLQAMGYQREEVVGQHHKLFCDPKYVQSDAYRRHWQLLNEGEPLPIILNVFAKTAVLFGYKGHIHRCSIAKGGWWKLLNLPVM